MPIYQYRERGGGVVELFRSIEQRDQVPPFLKRISVPQRVALFGTSNEPKEESSADAAVPKAFKELSNREVNRFVKESGFTVDKVKEVWGL